jgi:hypothetical protein
VSARIDVGETIGTAARLVRDRAGEIFRIGLVLIVGIYAVGLYALNDMLPRFQGYLKAVDDPAAQMMPPDPGLGAGPLLAAAAELLVIAIFIIGWHRLILLGSKAEGGLGVRLGRRELVCLGRIALCSIGVTIASIVFFLAEMVLAGLLGLGSMGLLLPGLAGFTIAVAYVMGRIAPAFAALAVDHPFGFAAAWRCTEGEGARLLAIYLLLGLAWIVINLFLGLVAALLGLQTAAPYAFFFVDVVLYAFLLAMLATVNAMVFRQLSGWRPAP